MKTLENVALYLRLIIKLTKIGIYFSNIHARPPGRSHCIGPTPPGLHQKFVPEGRAFAQISGPTPGVPGGDGKPENWTMH